MDVMSSLKAGEPLNEACHLNLIEPTHQCEQNRLTDFLD